MAVTKISDLATAVVTDLSEVHFAVDQTDLSATRSLTLADMQTLGPSAVVDTVADLATATPRDGQLWQTRGYTTVGDGGANVYRYDVAAVDAVDGGWVINGPSSVGRYLAVNTTVANVRQFGAAGDGLADDTAAVQSAIDRPSAAVVIPAGTYLVDAIDIDTTGASSISGNGTIKARVNQTSRGLILSSKTNAIFRGFTIDGDAKVPRGLHLLADSEGVLIDGITVRNCDQVAGNTAGFSAGIIVSEGCHRARLTACKIENINGSQNNIARGISVANIAADDPPTGVVISGCAIDNITPQADGDGIQVVGFTADLSLTIQGCTFTRCAKRAIKIQSPGVSVVGCTGIMNNVGGGNDPVAWIAIQASRVSVSGCYFSGVCLNNLVEVIVATEGVSISGNTFLCTNESNTSLRGILIGTDVIGLVINGNLFKATGTQKFQYGCYFSTSATCDEVAIAGNHFEGVRVHVIVNDTGNSTNLAITGNSAFGVTQRLYHQSTTGSDLGVTISGNAIGGIGSDVTNVPDKCSIFQFGKSLTASSADATPTVKNASRLTTANAAPTTITALDNGVDGQTVTVLINDANTTIDFTGTTLKGNAGADWTPTTGDHMTCTKIGANWYCVIGDNTP